MKTVASKSVKTISMGVSKSSRSTMGVSKLSRSALQQNSMTMMPRWTPVLWEIEERRKGCCAREMVGCVWERQTWGGVLAMCARETRCALAVCARETRCAQFRKMIYENFGCELFFKFLQRLFLVKGNDFQFDQDFTTKQTPINTEEKKNSKNILQQNKRKICMRNLKS